MKFNDEDQDFEPRAPEKPDYSNLSISDMLTRMQRAHIENLLAVAEGGNPSPQLLAQINRFLMDNGIVVAEVPKVIEGHAVATEKREALPDYSGEDYSK